MKSMSGAAALVVLILATLAVPSADAAESEFRVGVGFVTAQTLFELINDVVVTGATIGAIEPETETKSPAFFLEYSRYRSEKTRLTLHVNMTSFETDYLARSSGEALGTISDDFYTAMIGVSRMWANDGTLGFYSGLMLGATMLRTNADFDGVATDNTTLLAWQITPLGFRIGGDLALDVAAGVGHKGLFSFGAGMRF